jgi:hypothetical protein
MVCIRTSNPAPAPFSRLVWKFLVGRKIDESDICFADPELGAAFAKLREGATNETWTVTDWAGKVHPLRVTVAPVRQFEVDEYIQEYVEFRRSLLLPNLQLIKEGFMDNGGIGEKALRCLTWGDLRRMVEGDGFVSLEDILQALRFANFPNRILIEYFVESVRRLADEERAMLLKFATGKTRLPIVPQIRENFWIIVLYQPDERHGRDPMLRASTCFNRIYLGDYSSADSLYHKMVWSIQSTTMDNE